MLRSAALFGGIALTLLKKFGTILLAGTMDNPLFASFVLVVGLLVWLNLMSRIVLISAAWAANDLDVSHPLDDLSEAQRHKLVEGPEPAPLTAQARIDAGLPTFGQHVSDRTALAAGAVLEPLAPSRWEACCAAYAPCSGARCAEPAGSSRCADREWCG